MTTTVARTRPSGRGWAYLGITLGGAVSVAANVAHSFIPPHGAPTTWHPEPGAVVGAIVWPVFLFVAVEILARTPWPKRLGWDLLRFGGLLPVAAVAAFVSYKHLSGLLAHYGEERLVYTLGPLAVDGLMVMATAALLATRPAIRTTPVPTTETMSAVAPAPAAPVPVPPAPTTSTPTDPMPTPVQAPATVPRPVTVPPGPDRAPDVPTPDRSVAPVGHAVLPVTPVPAALLTRAAHLSQAHHTGTGTPITPGELAVRLRVDTRTATQLLDALHTGPATPIQHVNGNRREVTVA